MGGLGSGLNCSLCFSSLQTAFENPSIHRRELRVSLIAFHVWQGKRLKVWQHCREQIGLQSQFVKLKLVKTDIFEHLVEKRSTSFGLTKPKLYTNICVVALSEETPDICKGIQETTG